MKTLLVGNFGAKNIGDELILAAAIRQIGAENVVVCTSNSAFSQKFCGQKFETLPPFPSGLRSFLAFFFDRKTRQKFKTTAPQISKIVFPGGGLFAIRTKAFWIWGLNFLLAHFFFRVPIFLQNQGVDAPKNFLEKFFLKFVFSRAEKVSVRDEFSAEVLEKILGQTPEISGDLAHESLKKIKPKKDEKKWILLHARTEVSPEKWKKISDQNSPQLPKIFVAFEPSDLKFAPRNLDAKIVFPETETEVLRLFKSAEKVFGQRLHCLILGEIFAGPKSTFCLQMPYSTKVKNFIAANKIACW